MRSLFIACHIFKKPSPLKQKPFPIINFFCYRQFYIYDQEGGLLVDILAYFALLNPDTRKVATIPEDLVAPFKTDFVKKLHRVPKMPLLEQSIDRDYYVRYFDIDMNGHVNNSKYLDWMYDVLGYEFLKAHEPLRMTLKYVKEVSPGGQITSSYHWTN